MEGWRARLASAQVAFREDEEDDELEMQMALDQLQSFITWNRHRKDGPVVRFQESLPTLTGP